MHSRHVKYLVFFLVSYIFLYFLYASVDFLPKWDAYGVSILRGIPLEGFLFIDPLFLGIPVVGFVVMILALNAYRHHFKDEFVLSIPFALLFVVGSYVSFFVALMGYYWNNAYLVAIAQGTASAGLTSFGPALTFVMNNFLDQLLASPFFAFVLAALLGWLSYVIIFRYWNDSHSAHESAHPFSSHSDSPSPLNPST